VPAPRGCRRRNHRTPASTIPAHLIFRPCSRDKPVQGHNQTRQPIIVSMKAHPLNLVTLLAAAGVLAASAIAAETIPPKKATWTELADHITFACETVGQPPKGWTVAATGSTGVKTDWKVIEEKTAQSTRALALTNTDQMAKNTFNLCLSPVANFRTGNLQVKAKILSGKANQGGGLVWRAKDANNYYVLRYDLLEANFRLYKVIEGKRTLLKEVPDLKLPADEWFTIRVETQGNGIEAFLNGKEIIEADDSSLTEPGSVGFWTKADASTAFTDLLVGNTVVNNRFGAWYEANMPKDLPFAKDD